MKNIITVTTVRGASSKRRRAFFEEGRPFKVKVRKEDSNLATSTAPLTGERVNKIMERHGLTPLTGEQLEKVKNGQDINKVTNL